MYSSKLTAVPCDAQILFLKYFKIIAVLSHLCKYWHAVITPTFVLFFKYLIADSKLLSEKEVKIKPLINCQFQYQSLPQKSNKYVCMLPYRYVFICRPLREGEHNSDKKTKLMLPR